MFDPTQLFHLSTEQRPRHGASQHAFVKSRDIVELTISGKQWLEVATTHTVSSSRAEPSRYQLTRREIYSYYPSVFVAHSLPFW